MISPESQTWIVLLLAVVSVLALLLAGMALAGLKTVRRRLQDGESQLRASDENYHGLSLGALGQGQRLLELEQEQARLRSRLDALASSGDGSGSAFSQAIRMARKGSTAREIMEICGLGEIEADLVVLMHKGAPERHD
jgi:hypothetical protein